MRKKAITITLCLAIVGLVLGLLNTKGIRIQYHLWRFKVAHNQIWSGNSVNEGGGLVSYTVPNGAIENYDYHRDQLVDLGYLFYRRYTMDKLQPNEDAVEAFNKLLLNMWPSMHPPPALPAAASSIPGVWDFWGRVQDQKMWDNFFATNNVSEFQNFGPELINVIEEFDGDSKK